MAGTLACAAALACDAQPRSQSFTSDVVHDRVIQTMRDLAPRDIAGRDTLVTWASGRPILFHTASYFGDTLRAAMLRNDAMVGTAEVQWSSGVPATFDVAWTSSDSPATNVRGARVENDLRISGSRDTVLAVPSLPWGIADYGMESLLVPLLEDATGAVVILRPFAIKWDTLDVSTERVGDATIVTARSRDGSIEKLLLANHRLLAIRQAPNKSNRRPLEGTAAAGEYTRLTPTLGVKF
jgi:hypothetical protein